MVVYILYICIFFLTCVLFVVHQSSLCLLREKKNLDYPIIIMLFQWENKRRQKQKLASINREYTLE